MCNSGAQQPASTRNQRQMRDNLTFNRRIPADAAVVIQGDVEDVAGGFRRTNHILE